MTHLRSVSRVIVAMAVAACAMAGSTSAQEIVWHVPEDFPVGLEVPVCVTPAEKLTGITDYRIDVPQIPSGVAQRDRHTGKVWFLARIDADSRGTDISIQLPKTSLKHQATMKMERTNEAFQFINGRRPVMSWQMAPKSLDGKYERANYVHPLLGLDGQTLTQDFPSDHKHHRGVFWAWHQLWVGDHRAGDPWEAKEFLSVVTPTDKWNAGYVFTDRTCRVEWTSPRLVDDTGRPIPIVEEHVRIRCFLATDESQCIDFEISLKALLPDVKIGGSEDVKGYSGFTVRVKPPGGMVIVDSEGQLDADRVSKPAMWADVSGRFAEDDDISGIAILTHPTLPEFPPKWLLRHYGMQNVAWPGREPVALPMDKPVVLRHRLVIHRGDVEAGRVPEHQSVFAATSH